MIRAIKRTIYFCANAFFTLFALGAFYLLLAFVLGLFSVNNNFDNRYGEVEIFIVSNGSHASLALPAFNYQRDWHSLFNPQNTQNPNLSKSQPYILIGWGSKTFYTEAYRWKDVRPKTAVQALFFGKGVVSTSYIDTPTISSNTVSIKLNREQYQKLITAIEKEIVMGEDGKAITIDFHPQKTDSFYEAKSRYTPWRTCNQWTRNILSSAQVSTPVWAPFPQTIFWHIK